MQLPPWRQLLQRTKQYQENEPRGFRSKAKVDPWKVEKSEWWPMPWESPWSAQSIPYGETGLNMAAVGFVRASLLFRAIGQGTQHNVRKRHGTWWFT